jgi:hypothetical protein
LNRENEELRDQLEAQAINQTILVSRLHEAERRISDLSDELTNAQDRVREAEHRLAEFQSALDGFSQENRALRSALDRARRSSGTPPVTQAAVPFRKLLAAAHLRADRAETAVPPTAGLKHNSPAIFGPDPGRPWTA